MPEDFKVVRPEDVTDLALLPRRFDLFVENMRTTFDMFSARMLPALDRLEQTTTDIKVRLASMNADLTAVSKRVAVLEVDVSKIKKQIAPKRSRTAKKSKPARSRKARP